MTGVPAAGLPDGAVPSADPAVPPLFGFTVGLVMAGDGAGRECERLLATQGARTVYGPVGTRDPAGSRPPERAVRPVDRLADLVVTGRIDAVAFTSVPAVARLLAAAEDRGRRDGLIAALRTTVLAACLEPACAAPLGRLEVPTVLPGRRRIDALVSTICAELPARSARDITAAGHHLRVQGSGVVVDGVAVLLPPKTAAVLIALADRPGHVLSRAELLRRTGGTDGTGAESGGEHSVEMTVARLRAALGPAGVAVQTVVKRGYRLAVA